MGPRFKYILTCCIFFFYIGCTPRVVYRPAPVPKAPAPQHPIKKPPVIETKPEKPVEKPVEKPIIQDKEEMPAVNKPQELASLQLTEQARILLDSDRPDDAIRILERAVNLHPQNGEAYYYLAEAWLKKGNVSQAKEFHDLAAIYLENYRQWSPRIKIQEIKIKHF